MYFLHRRSERIGATVGPRLGGGIFLYSLETNLGGGAEARPRTRPSASTTSTYRRSQMVWMCVGIEASVPTRALAGRASGDAKVRIGKGGDRQPVVAQPLGTVLGSGSFEGFLKKRGGGSSPAADWDPFFQPQGPISISIPIWRDDFENFRRWN